MYIRNGNEKVFLWEFKDIANDCGIPELLSALIARSINVAVGPAKPICKLAAPRPTANEHTAFIIIPLYLCAYERAKWK